MSQEIYSYIMPKLFAIGALDVYFTSIFMKKNRPAVKLSVLCSQKNIKEIEELIFMETSTFGIRRTKLKRSKLKRNFKKIRTKYGIVSVKFGEFNGKVIKAVPEFSDCEILAKQNNVPIQKIFDEVKMNIKY